MRKVAYIIAMILILSTPAISFAQKPDSKPDGPAVELFRDQLPDDYSNLKIYTYSDTFAVITLLVEESLDGPDGVETTQKSELFIFSTGQDDPELILHDKITVPYEDTTLFCSDISRVEFAEWSDELFVIADGAEQLIGYNMFAPMLYVYKIRSGKAEQVSWIEFTTPGPRPYDWKITEYGLFLWMMDPDLPWHTEEFRIMQTFYSYSDYYGKMSAETTAYSEELYTIDTFPSEPLRIREYEG